MKPVSISTVSPSTPQPAGAVPVTPAVLSTQRISPQEPRSAKSVWLLRGALLFAVIGSAALVYWAYAKRLQPVTTEQREKAAQMTRIADDIEQLRFKWGPRQVEETKAEYALAKAVLFSGEDEIEMWKKRVRSEASMRVLELAENAGEPSRFPPLTNEVSILPMTFALEPMPTLVTTNTPYSRVLAFADGVMARTDKRFELVSLSVDGNSNSVARAVAVVNLFTFPNSP